MFKQKLLGLVTTSLILMTLATGPAFAESTVPASQVIAQQIEYQADKPAKKVIFSAPQYEIILFAFDKGQALKEHTVNFPAYIQVIEGEGILVLDGQEISIKAGEGFSLAANLPHAIKAAMRFKMLLIKQAGAL